MTHVAPMPRKDRPFDDGGKTRYVSRSRPPDPDSLLRTRITNRRGSRRSSRRTDSNSIMVHSRSETRKLVDENVVCGTRRNRRDNVQIKPWKGEEWPQKRPALRTTALFRHTTGRGGLAVFDISKTVEPRARNKKNAKVDNRQR
jgi:hypothetical protein